LYTLIFAHKIGKKQNSFGAEISEIEAVETNQWLTKKWIIFSPCRLEKL
jgi:hypothetical protein